MFRNIVMYEIFLAIEWQENQV